MTTILLFMVSLIMSLFITLVLGIVGVYIYIYIYTKFKNMTQDVYNTIDSIEKGIHWCTSIKD